LLYIIHCKMGNSNITTLSEQWSWHYVARLRITCLAHAGARARLQHLPRVSPPQHNTQNNRHATALSRCRLRLTDALTKLLMPGTAIRDISACSMSEKRLEEMDRL
jgi:hypothetical protein